MKRLAILLVPIVLAACTGIPGLPGSEDKQVNDIATEPTPAPDYFPMIEGATWTLKSYLYNSEETGTGTFEGSYLFRIKDVERSGDLATASLKVSAFDKDGKEGNVFDAFYVREADGIYRMLGSEKQLLAPWPLAEGSRTRKGATTTAYATHSAEVMTVSAGKSASTDIGKFENSYELVTTLTTEETNTTQVRTETIVLAPNIGVIREEVKTVRTGVTAGYLRSVMEIATYSIPVKK